MYHTLINPSVYMDRDGAYRGLDHEIHQAKDFTNYTVFSVWDTYRALHPLYNLLHPERSRDIIASMLAHYSQSVHGSLPIWSHMGNENWCMIGYHGVSVVADAYVKGIPMKEELALKAVLNSSTIPYLDGTKEYMKLGYVPLEKAEVLLLLLWNTGMTIGQFTIWPRRWEKEKLQLLTKKGQRLIDI